ARVCARRGGPRGVALGGERAGGRAGLALGGQFGGGVRGARLFPRVYVRTAADLLDKRLDLAPVDMSTAYGSLLVPLHPVNRIQGLRPGRRWRQPVLDPLAGSLAVFDVSPAGAVRFLDALVRPLPEPPPYKGRLAR